MVMPAPAALTAASKTIHLILNREGATLATLRDQLRQLRQRVALLPMTVSWPDNPPTVAEGLSPYHALRTVIQPQWPELGFYDAVSLSAEITPDTGEVGDALDDLADLVKDLSGAVQLASTDLAGGLSWLRFTADAHWGEHTDDLVRHLNFIVADGANTQQS